MKTILSLRRHHYLQRVGILLIAVVLIAGIVSCADGGDGTEPTPLDHYRAYDIGVGPGPTGMPYVNGTVEVGDQFGNWTANVTWGMALSTPVDKTYDGVTTEVLDEDAHFIGFALEGIEPKWWRVTVSNQFGTQELTVVGPTGVSVPTQKLEPGDHDPPEGYNCYLGYEVIDPSPIEVVVDDLTDQFASEQNVLVTQAKVFTNPAWMIYDGELMEIVNEDDHGVTYMTLTEGVSVKQHQVVVSNVFGQWTLNVTEQEEGTLSLPSEKISWEPIEPPLSHFRCYNAGGGTMPYVGEIVELKDQFGTFNATVGWGSTLCNPVEKAVNAKARWEWVPISDPDHHLMAYTLEGVEEQEWDVVIDNQFGTQELTVIGPIALAVPTTKEDHDPPEALDYFLCYNVTGWDPAVEVIVDLYDEFTTDGDNNFVVTNTWLFANPVQKITYGGNVTNIVSSDYHLVFYYASSELVSTEWHEVDVSNLFGACTLNVMAGNETLLAVPSEKVSYVSVP